MIGLDIVTFDEHNKRLYATVDMFLEGKLLLCTAPHPSSWGVLIFDRVHELALSA